MRGPHSKGGQSDALVADLRRDGFGGEFVRDAGRLPVWSTDGSVYRVAPEIVLFPKDARDVALACRLAARHALPLVARGGGTGTNGQSLTDGIVLDFNRHLSHIGEFDEDAMTIAVGPGVVLDGLNAFLAPHDCFFAPTVSTASRAVIGGMFGTDASGKGSRRYGRTSDHVVGVEIVTADGEIHQVKNRLTPDEARLLAMGSSRLSDAVRCLIEEIVPRRELVESVFPDMNRGLTGYNLKHAVAPDGSMDLIKLLAGSEGTLALTTRLILKVTRRPKFSSVAVLSYASFGDALGDVARLVEKDPLAVEIIDDKILRLARNDPLWSELGNTLGDLGDASSLLFVEFAADEASEVSGKIARLKRMVDTDPDAVMSIRILEDRAAVAGVWDLRRQSVGLLGALEGRRRASPFVEDCAVPPENLTAFAAGFRAILDKHGLDYGMFGHADVGCLHVRPTLDLTEPSDRRLLRTVSDEVAALARDHGGLLWGEHGRGIRGEYSPLFFGAELFDVLRKIKTAFDPDNILNPWKLAVPDGIRGDLLTIDGVPFRGEADADISVEDRTIFSGAISCNGNGACHDWNAANAMCPSFKATGDPVQSPKGRATLIREWARLRAIRSPNDADLHTAEEALFASLETCLSCRACTSRCPVRVDIPSMKSVFLERIHRERPRSLRDRFVRRMEAATLLARHVPKTANAALAIASVPIEKFARLSDLPRFPNETFEQRMKAAGIPRFDQCTGASHVLVADTFAGIFDVEVLAAAAIAIRRCGLDCAWIPPLANGKALEVRGYNRGHQAIQRKARDRLAEINGSGSVLVSVEPVATVTLRKICGDSRTVMSIDEVLDERASAGGIQPKELGGAYRLLSHCMESTAGIETADRWKRVFSAFGSDLTVERTGCCGMAGLFGHESEHLGLSRTLFDLSWKDKIDGKSEALATGFSCREQAARFARRLRHPVEALAEATSGTPAQPSGRSERQGATTRL